MEGCCEMHRFIFSSKDAFIDNHPDERMKNFGRDEILEISSKTYVIRSFQSTSPLQSTSTDYIGLDLIKFNGTFTGSMTGSASDVNGDIIGCGLVLLPTQDCG